jgi:hypothetical protein
MFLVLCRREYEDEMICDLAEVYHMFNYEEYPPILVGTLLFGLRDDSRVKMALSGQNVSLDRYLMARAVDELAFLSWTKTKDAQNNRHRPKSILQKMMGEPKKEEYATFETMEEFMEMWNAI